MNKNKIKVKKIIRFFTVLMIVIGIVFSNIPFYAVSGLVNSYLDARDIVDVAWNGQKDGQVVDKFASIRNLPEKLKIHNAQAAVSYRTVGAYNSATSATAVVPKPAGTVNGDLMFVVIRRAAAIDPTGVPAGWTLIQKNLSTYGYWLYYKVASGEGASWTWTWAAAAKTLGRSHSFYGGFFDPSNPIQNSTTPYNGTASGTAITIPTLTTSANNTVSFLFPSAFSTIAKTFTVPTSPAYAEHNDTGNTNPDFWQAIASYTYPTSGTATGAIAYPASAASTYRVGVQVLVNPAPVVQGIAGSLGKTADGWAGAVPVYGTLTGGLTYANYPYARAQATTIAGQTFYADMAWDSGDSRFEGVIYPGSNLCMGCDDPKTYNGSFSVVVQLDNNAGFPSIDYSAGAVTFTTAITLKRSSMDNVTATNYTDFNAVWSTDHWNVSIDDFGFAMNAGTGTNFAVAVPIYPDTSSPSNFAVTFNGTSVSQGSAQSSVDTWWYDSASHTLYLQFASLTTTLKDVDIDFDSDTDLFATRYNWTYTADMGSRKFSNGLYIANRYLTTFYYGKPFSSADNNVACSGNECEGTGMQAESRAHEDGGPDESTDCMERIAVHVDGTPRSDGTTYYQYDTKWKQTETATWITSQDNNQMVVVTNSDDTASTGWAQQLNNGIAIERTQTYYAGKRYIKNIYALTNNSGSTHSYPIVWEREQWHGTDRATNDKGRFQGDTSDVTMEQRVAMSGYSCPWQTAYDSGTFINMGMIYDKSNLPDYGIFAVEPFLAPTVAEWPITITSGHGTQTNDQTGFEKTFSSVAPSETVSFTFWHVHNAESSWANIASAMDADCAELNPAVVSILIGDGDLAYGMVSTSADTTGVSGDTQTVINNGSVAEDFEIVGQDSANWNLGGTAGNAIYKHEWCISNCDSSPVWNALTTAYQTLATNIAATSYVDVDFKITVPTSNQGSSEQDVNITIRAVEH